MCPKPILECPAPEASAVSLAWPSFLWLELEPSTAFPTLSPLLPPHCPCSLYHWAPFLLALPLAAACLSFGSTLSGAPAGLPSALAASVWSPRAPESTQQHPCILLVPFLPVYLGLGDASPLSTPDYITGQLFLLGCSHYPGPWPLLGHRYVFAEEVSERPQATGAKLRCTHSSRCTQGACQAQTWGTGAAVGRPGGSSSG